MHVIFANNYSLLRKSYKFSNESFQTLMINNNLANYHKTYNIYPNLNV